MVQQPRDGHEYGATIAVPIVITVMVSVTVIILVVVGLILVIVPVPMVALDNPRMQIRKGELAGYDGFKHRKGTKIHVCVNKDSIPLRIVIGLGMSMTSRSF